LHGILGSTEVLAELDLDSTVSTLAGQIDSCGRTLLDIIDHLLDFATLKGQRLKKGVASSSRIGHRIPARERKASADEDIADLETSVSLDDLTEEAIESTVYSFLCKKGANYEPRASVILDIDRSRGTKWHCKLATGGWRRVCINLVTNALKYTPSGYIRVSLTQKPRAGSRRHFDAILTVSDTGKGMSKDFLENQLFRDFTQEDTLADGIGLGMHMVGRILHAIGGKIEVVSDQHGDQAGTSITVNVPLEHGQGTRSSSDDEDTSLRGSLAGLKAGIFSHETSPFPSESREKKIQSAASAQVVSSIEDSCRYLGLQLQKGESADCDLTFYLEEDFERSRDAGKIGSNTRLKGKPCIVICRSTPLPKTLKALRSKDITRTGRVVEYVGLPCGVKSVSRAISSALKRQKEFESTAPERDFEEQSQRLAAAAEIANVEEIELPPSIHPIPRAEDIPVRPKFESFPTYPDDHDQLSPRAVPNPPTQQDKQTETATQTKAKPQTITQTPKDSGTSIPTTTQTTTPKIPTLLLVDDNKVNLQLLTMYAKKRKYPYLEAMDGQLAVNAYQKAHEDSISPSSTTASGAGKLASTVPAIILMDINMPVVSPPCPSHVSFCSTIIVLTTSTMDGYVATQRIRSYEKKHQLTPAKIIALTALGSEAAYKEAFGSGCDMFLTKPVKLKDLTKIIEGEGEGA
jgi:CheY-like chemotaxis protein